MFKKTIVAAMAFFLLASPVLADQATESANDQVNDQTSAPQLQPAFNNVVIFLDTLVTFIPDENASLFPKKDVISTAESNANYKYTCVIRPYVRDLISYLLDHKIKVQLTSDYRADFAKILMKNIVLPKSGNKSLEALLPYKEVNLANHFSPKDYGDPAKTLLITYSDVQTTQADQTINLGKIMYAYPSYAVMKQHRDEASQQKVQNFPKDERAWELDNDKIARLLFYLVQANRGDKQTFLARMKSLKAEDQIKLTRLGVEMANGTYQSQALQWKTDAQSKVTGCQLVDNLEEKVVREADLSECQETLGKVAAFKVDKATARVQGCEYRTKEGFYLSDADSVIDCIDLKKSPAKFAVDFSTKQCSAFTQSMAFIDTTGAEVCDNKTYAVFDEKNKAWISFQPSEKMKSMTPSQVLEFLSHGVFTDAVLKYKTSFHSMITARADNDVKRTVADDCIAAIKKHLQSGKNFYSERLLQKYTLSTDNFPVKELRDGQVFHYTNASEAGTAFSRHNYSSIFNYLRTGMNTYSWYLYAAADSESSSGYGKIKVVIQLRPHALIFLSNGDKPGASRFNNTATSDDIENDLISRNPGLGVCERQGPHADQRDHTILVDLALEASGVDAIAYIGINNKQARNGLGTSEYVAQWLELVGPWSISKASVH